MEFKFRYDHVYVVDAPEGTSRISIRENFQEFLEELGITPWVAEECAVQVRIDRAYWSDSYNGFTHPCAEHIADGVPTDPATCHPDTREEVVIGNLPRTLIEVLKARGGE
jgi:hypothetical protein